MNNGLGHINTNNVTSIQTEPVVIRNGLPVWRNSQCLSDDELFSEYRALKEEMRRRQKSETFH